MMSVLRAASTKVIVRNSLIAVIASLAFLAVPLVFPAADIAIREITRSVVWAPLMVVATAALVLAGHTVLCLFFSGEEARKADAPVYLFVSALAAALGGVLLGIVMTVSLHETVRILGFAAYATLGAGFFTWLRVTRASRAVKRAEREAAEMARVRAEAISARLAAVPGTWLIDAVGVAENTDSDTLMLTVAEMSDGTEFALVRAHRKGVKADDVAPLIAAGSFTEADADRLAREVA